MYGRRISFGVLTLLLFRCSLLMTSVSLLFKGSVRSVSRWYRRCWRDWRRRRGRVTVLLCWTFRGLLLLIGRRLFVILKGSLFELLVLLIRGWRWRLFLAHQGRLEWKLVKLLVVRVGKPSWWWRPWRTFQLLETRYGRGVLLSLLIVVLFLVVVQVIIVASLIGRSRGRWLLVRGRLWRRMLLLLVVKTFYLRRLCCGKLIRRLVGWCGRRCRLLMGCRSLFTILLSRRVRW